jgi:hypothetical protein
LCFSDVDEVLSACFFVFSFAKQFHTQKGRSSKFLPPNISRAYSGTHRAL